MGFFKDEMLTPARKDFFEGLLVVLMVSIVVLIVITIWHVVQPIVALVSPNPYIQVGLGFLFIFLLGLVKRKVKESKKSWILRILPTETLDKPEVLYKSNGEYKSGILLYHQYMHINGKENKFAAIAKINAGPTSITLLSPDFVAVDSDYPKVTGRTMRDAVKELVTLGATSPRRSVF